MHRAPSDTERYAEALLALGEATGHAAQIEQDLVVLLDLLECDEDVRRFLADATVKKAGKEKALEKLLKGRIHYALTHFLLILLEENRLAELRPIAESFFARYSSQRQQATGTLTTAVPLSSEKVADIEQAAGRLLGKDVHLRVQVNPVILGGLRIQVGDFVVDGTVDNHLAEMRARLLA